MAHAVPTVATRSPPAPSGAMDVSVSGKHLEVGEALRTRIAGELEARVGKYFDRGGEADVFVGKEGHALCVDLVVRLPSGQRLVAKGQGGDAHAAFDDALVKVETRIRRYKRRLTNHHPGGPSPKESVSLVVFSAPDDADDSGFEDDYDAPGGEPGPAVIAESQAELKTLTVSMAVMELDLTEAPVVVFRNAAHGGLSVVYRRLDQNIGWIDPERTLPRPSPQKTPRPGA